MDNTQPIPAGYDPTAVNMARAIRVNESSNNYNNLGDPLTKGGTNYTSSGAYQWNNGKTPLSPGEIPANFKTDAQKYGLNPNDFSPTNQDNVAYNKIKDLISQGYNVPQVASIWNSGTPNGYKTIASTTAYSQKVNDTYQQLKAQTTDQSQTNPNQIIPTPAGTTPYAGTSLTTDIKDGAAVGGIVQGLGQDATKVINFMNNAIVDPVESNINSFLSSLTGLKVGGTLGTAGQSGDKLGMTAPGATTATNDYQTLGQILGIAVPTLLATGLTGSALLNSSLVRGALGFTAEASLADIIKGLYNKATGQSDSSSNSTSNPSGIGTAPPETIDQIMAGLNKSPVDQIKDHVSGGYDPLKDMVTSPVSTTLQTLASNAQKSTQSLQNTGLVPVLEAISTLPTNASSKDVVTALNAANLQPHDLQALERAGAKVNMDTKQVTNLGDAGKILTQGAKHLNYQSKVNTAQKVHNGIKFTGGLLQKAFLHKNS